jgi:hypothetical protein
MRTPERHQKSIFNTQKVKSAGSTQNPKKLSEHQIYQSGRKFFQKKYV